MRRSMRTKRKRVTRTKKKSERTTYNLEKCEALLENIYWNGFEGRRGPFRVDRASLRELFGVEKFQRGALQKLAQLARKAGFILFPLDQIEQAKAREWIFDNLKRISGLPVADETAISRAQNRADETIS
jgi:hypothetical protein